MICNKNEESARIAADFLKCGKICVLPTDTVYGFSGIAENSLQAKFGTDAKIRKIKESYCGFLIWSKIKEQFPDISYRDRING